MLHFLLTPLLVLAQPDPSPPEMLPDAELTAVTFADADRGWAVGDRGAIWHSDDGGRNWKLQRSPVACRLEAVQFLDGNNGLIVGGWTQPYTHQTHGVVLRTRDGGRTWQDTPGLTLPGLKHLKMIDSRQGWACGDCSALYPSGLFRTEDGGRTWSSVSKGEALGWVTGDFQSVRHGVVAGLGGTLGIVQGGEIKPPQAPIDGPRCLRRLLLSGETGGWLVGDGGLVLTTGDGGRSWTAPPSPLPGVAGDLDLRALAVRGSRVWVAGAPGTCVLHSPDAGQTWLSFRTDQTAPLLGLWFADEFRGWAVGSLGTILYTRDGGQTWRPAKNGGTRVSLLGIFSAPERVPLDLIASQAASESYLTAVEIIGRRDLAPLPPAEELTAARRTHAAVVAAGGSAADSAWQFPLAEAGLVQSTDSILARWNLACGGKAAERLEEHLVRRIRQWRPEVIVTEDVSPLGDDPQGHLTNQIVLAAVAKAADAAALPEQLARTGLAAWRVKKVFAVVAGDKPGVVNVTPAQWAQPLGCTLAEYASRGRALLSREVITAPRTVGLSLLINQLPQNSGKSDVLGGISLQFGSDCRRLAMKPPAGDQKVLAELAQKRQVVEQLLTRIDRDETLGAGWLGQVNNLTHGLSERQSGEIVWQLARKYHEIGKGEQAAEALTHLVERYPQHPLADGAALWLVQYFASSEVSWRQRKEAKSEVQAAAAAGASAPISVPGENPIHRASYSSTAAGQSPAQRAGRVLALMKQIEQQRPGLSAEPALRFCLATASRQAGQPRNTERLFQSLAATAGQPLWARNGAAELWLLHPKPEAPKKVCSVVAAGARPKLDGRLDEPLWQAARPVSLRSGRGDDAGYPAAAVLTYDEEFLYVAVSCRRAPGVDYATDELAKASGRTSDAELSARDHVTLCLDLDRDYSSFWQLAIDDRGWPAESCFGDTTWNPQWYIAAGGDEQFWTVEAAIPWAELAPRKPQAGDAWAVGIQRMIPRIGLQSFTAPASALPRAEAFGLLTFD